MTALKSTLSSTALVRVLALPMMMGALAGCDYASKLPDAPSSVGGYQLSQKPPSVTGEQQADRLPPPRDAFANLKAPVEDRTKPVGSGLQMPPKTVAEAPKAVMPKAAAPQVMAPKTVAAAPKPGAQKPLAQIPFEPLEFEAIETRSVTVAQSEFVAPPLEMTSTEYTPPSYQVSEAPLAPIGTQSAALDTYAISGTSGQMDAIAYQSAPAAPTSYDMVPVESYAIAAAPAPMTYESAPAPAPRAVSQIAILRSRLPNGAVVNVHPVIGAPGTASATLARTVVMTVGAPINENAAQNAQAVFDLRGKAERNTEGYVAVEWTLYDADKKVVGVFPERQNGENWKQMSDSSLRAMGQRVADRIARNGSMREATLYAAAQPSARTTRYATMAPIGETMAPVGNTTFVMETGATLASAPMPRVSPRAATTFSAPVQVAVRPAPVQIRPAPRPMVAPAAPRPMVVTQAPAPMIAPPPVQLAPKPQIITQAPAQPTAPAPSFPTLRAVDSTPVAAPTVVASGPRPLVFRGVQGAPGDGDVALTREVGKLLQQSGARMASQPQPGALFLTAQVSKTAGSTSDRIEIVWRVQDGQGVSIGQVTQANDVPRGMLDQAWGEDAYYAAQGARDGIMELLQSSGALEG